MPTPPPQSGFPLKTALAILTIALALLVWHRFAPATLPPGLDWHNLPEVAKLPEFDRNKAPHHDDTQAPEPDIANSGESSQLNAPGKPDQGKSPNQIQGPQQPPGALLIDNAGSLDHFYASLAALEAHKPRAETAVVHFGDSPTTADLITGDVRQQLQAKFGDAGQGFNLIAKPWAWYGHRDIDESDHGWKFTTAVGFMREGPYGIGGASFDGTSGAGSKFKLNGAQQNTVELVWQKAPDGGEVEIDADGNNLATVDTSKLGDSDSPDGPDSPSTDSAQQFGRFTLPAGTKTVELKVTSGHVRLFGILFLRDQPGLTYDSIGLNGASITVLSRALSTDMMKTGFAGLQPDLVVINYGTNEAGFGAFIDKQYEGELRTAIARVKAAAPTASILVMSPMDRGQRAGGNGIETMPTIPKLVAIQERVAADTGCAFFNTFQAMGGEGTMQRWYDSKPRLVGGDLIHPSPAGAKIVATAFVDQLEQGYSRYTTRTQQAAPKTSTQAAGHE